MTVHHAKSEDEAKPGDWVLFVLDNSDQAGALGYHDQTSADVIYGRVFAQPCLTDGGSTALQGPYSVSSVLSHEVLETLVDPHCNLWAERSDGVAIAYEVCDPVESFTYTVHDRYSGDITVSDFVTPEWFDENRSPGERFDFLGKAVSPFVLTPGGYWIQAKVGGESQSFAEGYDRVRDDARAITYVFGPDFPHWKKVTKMTELGRTGRRSRLKPTVEGT